MFLEKEEIYTSIQEYQLEDILGDELQTAIRSAILAAVQEATSYLNSKYDCNAIFTATGADRYGLLVEHVKAIAVWYLIKRANTDMIFDRAKEYYQEAIKWLRLVAGTEAGSKPLAPDLPLKTLDGEVKVPIRYGGNRKFNHHGWD